MRILFVADGRSPIALNWIRHFIETGHEVHLGSTFACAAPPGLASLHLLAVGMRRDTARAGAGGNGRGRGVLRRAAPVGLLTRLRQWLGPLGIPAAARRLRALIDQVQPDLVHAMRIPFEGMIAAAALEGIHRGAPLLVSVWGNDFTLHASATPFLKRWTRRALLATDALHADCQRDVRLAHEWGFALAKPAAVLPGAGGIQLEVFYPAQQAPDAASAVVINPRGLRAYVRNDTFFQAIPQVLAQRPEARFLCAAMAGEGFAEDWVNRLGLRATVELLAPVPRAEMAELFRRSLVAVSPSEHDGTPNTLLEAMACGCFPVAGDIESLREWISDGENGLLVDPGDPAALAGAILRALGDAGLRRQAAEINTRLVAERADYRRVMAQAEGFYRSLVQG